MNTPFSVHLTSLEETQAFGLCVASLLHPGQVLGLKGPIGAGKTTLVQAIALGLKVPGLIQSPTFNLFRMHEGGVMPFWHFDSYRLEGHPADLGFDEYLEEEGVALIEWPEFFPGRLPPSMILFSFQIVNETERIITCSSNHSAWINQLEQRWQSR